MTDAPDLIRLDGSRRSSQALVLDPSGTRELVFLSKASLDLEGGGVAGWSPVPDPIAGADLPLDPESESPVLYESDLVPFKPYADVLCVGSAYAPGGRPTTQLVASFGVGGWRKDIRVVGDRRWTQGLLGLGYFRTQPEAFVSMPLHFGRAYGGKDVGKPKGHRHYARNRVGLGYSKYGFGVSGAPLPNLEDPRKPIRSWRSRPRPMAFGPVGRTWQPRLARAGTYDKRWLAQRAPEPPRDFDERFYNCAPDDQQIEGYLRGDETVTALNLHPEHPRFECRLPGIRVRCLLDRPRGEGSPEGGPASFRELFEVPLHLDTLWVDMEALRMVLVWRGRLDPAAAAESTAYLMVEEPLADPPRDPQSYLPLFAAKLAEETDAWADEELAEAERALEEATRPEEPEARELLDAGLESA